MRGFTLVEIAVVLIIIGLLLGGVLKGQELITQAKIRNAVTDLNGVTAAVYAYQDRYRQVPGDDGTAAARWPTVGSIAAASNGDGNRVVGGTLTAAAGCAPTGTGENCLLWNHLRRSGLIIGDLASAETPLNSSGGFLHAQAGALGLSGLVVCATNLSGKIAGAIDTQIDDGNPTRGTVRAGSGLATDTAASAYVDDGSALYTLCKQI
jgi:prepilin-type N-terminal cleavage/methylation domain-containing protein